MKTKTQNECFNCLDFKDDVQTEIYEHTKGMSRTRLKKYFEKQVESGHFADLWKRIPTRSARSR